MSEKPFDLLKTLADSFRKARGPHSWCPACGGTGEGPVSRVLVTTCPHRLRFERSKEMILGWTCPEHLLDCPRVYAEDDGPCPKCKGSGLAGELPLGGER